MTDERLADLRRMVDSSQLDFWLEREGTGLSGDEALMFDVRQLLDEVARLRAAVAAEREACALIAEEGKWHADGADRIASLIRARGKP